MEEKVNLNQKVLNVNQRRVERIPHSGLNLYNELRKTYERNEFYENLLLYNSFMYLKFAIHAIFMIF